VKLQAFAGTVLYLYLPENTLLSACILLFLYYFFVLFVPLLVEAAFSCSFSVASNGFVRTNLIYYF
jgi:hypothetical protein